MHPKTSLPRDEAAKRYVSNVVDIGFPSDSDDWEADLESSYRQGWEDAIAWYKAQSSARSAGESR